MCSGAEIGLILAATGTGVQAYNTDRSLRRQDAALADGLRKQGRIQREANTRVNDEIAALGASTGAAERAESLRGFQDALRATDAAATSGITSNVIDASPRFAERVTQAVRGIRDDANTRAGRLSVIDGARLQRINEGISRGRAGLDLNEIGRQSQGTNYLAQLRAREEQPNPWVNALGQAMAGAGTSLAMGGSAATASAQTPYSNTQFIDALRNGGARFAQEVK